MSQNEFPTSHENAPAGYLSPHRPRQLEGARSGSQPKTSGHDTVLRAIQNKESPMTIVFLSGESLKGTLVARDPYTMTLRTADGVRHVIFKHSVERFFGQESAPTESKGQ